MAVVSDAARLAALEEIVKRRTKTLDYLQRVYGGTARFMNLFEISGDEVVAAYPSERNPDIAKKVERWFALGISLATLIQSVHGATFVRSLAQLLEEFDYYYGHAASKGFVSSSRVVSTCCSQLLFVVTLWFVCL